MGYINDNDKQGKLCLCFTGVLTLHAYQVSRINKPRVLRFGMEMINKLYRFISTLN